MKVTKLDNRRLHLILKAMAFNKVVLGRIASRWNPKMFKAPEAQTFGDLCVKYYTKYGKAPKRHLEHMVRAWGERHASDAAAALLDNLTTFVLEQQSIDPKLNADYVIDIAAKYFSEVQLRLKAESILGKIDAGQLEEAERLATEYIKLDLTSSERLDPLLNCDNIDLEEGRETLISYPGPMGEFFGDALRREAFIAIQASEKSGKSFWLLEFMFRALTKRRNVAYFECGDLTRRDLEIRIWQRVTRKPWYTPNGKWPVILDIPVEISCIGDFTQRPWAEVSQKTESHAARFDNKEIKVACERFMRETVKSNKSHLGVSVNPNSTINVDGIRSKLDTWEAQDGWTPDVILVDYADILAPPPGRMEVRDQINTTWKQLRRLSQEMHALVVTATQADADSYDCHTQRKRNFSEDKRKYSHVDGIITINQVPEERDRGVVRLDWLYRREVANRGRQIHVAGCLGISRPWMKACWRTDWSGTAPSRNGQAIPIED